MGWRNPTYVIGHHMAVGERTEVVVAQTAPEAVDVWASPADDGATRPTSHLALRPGDRYPLQAVDAGPEASVGTSTEDYHLWYHIKLSDETAGWVQAAVPSTHDTGSDGRPSSVQFILLPAELASAGD
jgi:hypothetical protein